MPAFNAEEFITASIESIINQSFKDWELIVVDDGSTDRTFSIVQSFTDNRIKIIHQKENSGLTIARKVGIRASTGKYIAFMDADDISLKNRFQKQIELMEAMPNLVLCGSFATIINQQGDFCGTIEKPMTNHQIKSNLFFGFPFCTPTTVMLASKAKLFAQAESDDWHKADDYVLFSRLMIEGEFVNIDEPLLLYRIHENEHRITDDRNNADIVHGRMIAWRQQLSYWQLTASHEVLLLHDKLCYYRQRITASDMACAENYLELLAHMLQRNTTSQLLDANNLAGEMSARVYSLLIHAQLPPATALRLGFQYRHLMLGPARQKLMPNKLRRWLLRMPH